MPKTARLTLKTVLRFLDSGTWEQFLGSLAAWSRHQLARLSAVSVLVWLAGSLAIYLAERRDNPQYRSPVDALWNVWLLLFSGMNDAPTTLAGRLLAMLLILVGVVLMGFFTATVASLLVERFLRRRHVTDFAMDDHLVLCNWDPRGLEWIREVHSRIIQHKRPVVIIHDSPDDIDFPDKQEEAAFSDVYIVKGDPSNEVVLRRAKVQRAYSVVILSDAREGKHADGKTILTCIAIRGICRGEERPNIAVECLNAANRIHLKRAGADEIISSEELGLRLLARASLFHGMTRVYQELLTVGRDANELYVVPAPEELLGKGFAELSGLFARRREDRLSCLLVGIQRGDEMLLNPVGEEAGPLQAEDQLILLSRVYPGGNQGLPTAKPEANASIQPPE
jgi:voltage-gated potassium channel